MPYSPFGRSLTLIFILALWAEERNDCILFNGTSQRDSPGLSPLRILRLYPTPTGLPLPKIGVVGISDRSINIGPSIRREFHRQELEPEPSQEPLALPRAREWKCCPGTPECTVMTRRTGTDPGIA